MITNEALAHALDNLLAARSALLWGARRGADIYPVPSLTAETIEVLTMALPGWRDSYLPQPTLTQPQHSLPRPNHIAV